MKFKNFIALNDSLNAVDHRLPFEWLAKETLSAACLCSLAHRFLGVGRNENDGYIQSDIDQLTLQFKATHTRHLNVRDQARRVFEICAS